MTVFLKMVDNCYNNTTVCIIIFGLLPYTLIYIFFFLRLQQFVLWGKNVVLNGSIAISTVFSDTILSNKTPLVRFLPPKRDDAEQLDVCVKGQTT